MASVAITAVAFYGAGELIAIENAAYGAAAGEESFFTGVPSAAIVNYVGPGSVAAIHAGAGAIAGGLTSAINHGNVGLGMLTGAISAGVAKFAGSYIENEAWGVQFAGRSAIGATTGGITSSIYGGNFGKGFVRGGEISAAAFVFNDWLHCEKKDGRLMYNGCTWIKDPETPLWIGEVYANLVGLAVTLEAGPKLGVIAHDIFETLFSLSPGGTGDLPIFGTPYSIPDAINPPNADGKLKK